MDMSYHSDFVRLTTIRAVPSLESNAPGSVIDIVTLVLCVKMMSVPDVYITVLEIAGGYVVGPLPNTIIPSAFV